MKERVDLGIWSQLTQIAFALVAVAAVIFIGMTYLPVIQKNERMRRDIDRLQTELDQQKQLSQQMQQELNALHNDPNTVSRLARSQINYAQPGETVFRFTTTNADTQIH